MKASAAIDVHSSPSLTKVITRLALLGGFILGGMYAFLHICSSLIKIFQ
jgi:hypothetical protein